MKTWYQQQTSNNVLKLLTLNYTAFEQILLFYYCSALQCAKVIM